MTASLAAAQTRVTPPDNKYTPAQDVELGQHMIQAAAVEGEVAGVMTHELSHVMLRHGTAGATKQQPFAIGAIAGLRASAATSRKWSRRAPSLGWAPTFFVIARVCQKGQTRVPDCRMLVCVGS